VKFTVDPWDPSYGASVQSELGESTTVPVTDIECEPEAWAPIASATRTTPAAVVLFVDGVRRIEARTWVEGGVEPVPGVFASWAAGIVRCDGEAKLLDVEVGRGVFAPGPSVDDVHTSCGTFLAIPTSNARPETLNTEINTRMTEVEARIAERARRAHAELIVLDGPLRESTRRLHDAVGVVKSHDVKYLPVELDRVVSALGAGERTPVFRIEARFPRFSWYVRLPGPPGGPWAGVIRCEASGSADAAEVVTLADRVTATLPRYASEPHKDPRAPQNLYPIAGLERALRRRLGDQHVLYRALRRASVSAA
jgi:hypothetical protein